ncbi:radical SAM protein [Thiobacter aerophilum]|uniref:Radical SAM protein n=1 Tax=Thiobacter aerophilum TaxID=3121275 RepID=A0ABV0EGL9_9BURK
MMQISTPLSVTDHRRDIAGMTYVYPVVSRRAGGVSVGINLNTNNACNWRCIYCQVPNLIHGAAPPTDLALLTAELRTMLQEILHGRFLEERVPEGARRLNDIALSGNGEPTSAKAFPEVIESVGQVLVEFELVGAVRLVLITNGSLVHQTHVQAGLARMAQLHGEVWFKLDAGTRESMRRINGTQQTPDRTLKNLVTAAGLCPTWVQTCVFALDGEPPAADERQAYLDLLARALKQGVRLEGVLLYGLARPSLQPEAARLSCLSAAWLEDWAAQIQQRLGLAVKVTP